MAMKSVHTGMIILGGGLIKHHICNANLMVNICLITYYQYCLILFFNKPKRNQKTIIWSILMNEEDSFFKQLFFKYI